MRVIITGGSGLIGRELAAALGYAGHEVIVLSRFPERVTDLPSKVRVVAWDGHTAQGWGQLAEGADGIVNLAGASLAAGRWTGGRKNQLRESRLNAGQAVVEAVRAAAQKPRVVIQASGAGYYGPRGREEVTEITPAGNDFLAQLCKAWEASTAPVEALGVRRAIVRTGIVLSPVGGALPRLLTPFRFFVGGPLGNGEQWFPWIHFTDAANALRFLLEKESATGAFNLGAPAPVTNADFSRALARRLRRPSWLAVPGFALRLALGQMADLLLTGQRLMPKRLTQSGFRFTHTTVEGAIKDVVF